MLRVKSVSLALLIILAAALCAIPATADEPPIVAQAALGTTFTYQGRLNDSTGAPLSGSFDFRFTLHDALTGGNQVGTCDVAAVPVDAGLFAAAVDFGDDVFTGAAYWLQVAVRPAGGGTYEALAPRTAITAAPYALGLVWGASMSGSGRGFSVASSDGIAIDASSASLNAVQGTTNSGAGVYGYATGTGIGVSGTSTNGWGVQAYSANSVALRLLGTGSIQSSAVSHVFVPGGEANLVYDVAPGVSLRYYSRGTVMVVPSTTGDKKVLFSVAVPAVLYGQPVRVAGLRVYYDCSNAASYIKNTYMFREQIGTLDDPSTAYTLISEAGATHDSTTSASGYYDLSCSAAECRLSADEGFVTVRLDLHFANTGDTITLGGIRVTLEHD